MRSSLADRLNAARHQQFVGRRDEMAQFNALLLAQDLPCCLYYLYGQGGVGKTTLLREFLTRCEAASVPAISVDGRNIEPSAEAFLEALRQALSLAPDADLFRFLNTEERRRVIFVDTYEEIRELESWLHGVFCPKLPQDTLLVFAGRLPPSDRWTSDAGWRSVLRAVRLPNLTPNEAQNYLENRDVPANQRASVLDFTQGHPLALSLAADVFAQQTDFQFQPEAAPDMIQNLLSRFTQEIHDAELRAALEACAVVRLLTEPLLAELLEIPDAQPLFLWLNRLSFIEAGRYGLFPHDLVRAALIADLRWRNPERYAELNALANRYYGARIHKTTGQEQQRLFASSFFLNRENPTLRAFFKWHDVSSVTADALRPTDIPALLAMTARHEGEESAKIAAYWLTKRPQWCLVTRSSSVDAPESDAPLGYLLTIPLQETSEQEAAFDPALPACRRHLEKTFPLRSGEFATVYRFWMARDTYQSVSPTQSLIFVNMVRQNLTTPGLAISYCPCAAPDFWETVFAFTEIRRAANADFTVGNRHYGMYEQDWRVLPPSAWQTLMQKKAILSDEEPFSAVGSGKRQPLCEADFASAVRDALRGYAAADGLRGNPLLQSRLVLDLAEESENEAAQIEILRALLRETIEALESAPRSAKLYRALRLTYLKPAPTQEQAAERLDLPFSTFRRHLTDGVARIIEILWRREIA